MPRLVGIRRAADLAVLIFLLGVPQDAGAKCPTARLEFVGDALSATLVIDNQDYAGQFNIWNGPGVLVNDEPVHLDTSRKQGAFIDWPSGPIDEPPDEGLLFFVKFFCINESSGRKRLIYVVDYLIDADSDSGYIFLPGEGNPWYMFNTHSIAHGVESKWFRSSPEWERLIRPLLVQAITAKAGTT